MKTIQKKRQFVLVPTDNTTIISKNKYGEIGFTNKPTKQIQVTGLDNFVNQHLYILSDEDAKIGDWVLAIGQKSFLNEQQMLCKIETEDDLRIVKNLDCKKIIATTNHELRKKSGIINVEKRNDFLDQIIQKPTDQFIQDWIDAKCPEFVNVEYEPQVCQNCGTSYCDRYQCKQDEDIDELIINEDNTITCSFIEDDWDTVTSEFRKYRQSLDSIETISAFEHYLKENYNPPTLKTK